MIAKLEKEQKQTKHITPTNITSNTKQWINTISASALERTAV